MIKVILWDIDGTLLEFGQAENYAMKKCFSVLEMGECTDAMVERYAAINTKYWERLERNEITKQEVLIGRFREFFENEGLPLEKAQLFNEEHTFGILAKIGTYQKDEIVIVGDSLTSDMQGGNNAGIVCCWYNPKEERNTKGLHIDYEIKNLMDLNKILFTN